MFKEARLQARVSMNEGRDCMFDEDFIGPQRSVNQPPSTQTTDSSVPQETTDSSQNGQSTTVQIKEEPMDVQESSGQEQTQEQRNVEMTEGLF